MLSELNFVAKKKKKIGDGVPLAHDLIKRLLHLGVGVISDQI
jgi:hypothetical protein